MTQEAVFHSGVAFDQLDIPSALKQDLFSSGFDEASEIQKQSIPIIITPPYKSLLAQSQNGTGKTLSFVTGMLARIDVNDPNLQAVCLFATRELVIQTYTDYIKKLTKHYQVNTTVLIRDPPIPSDVTKAQLILSTPMQLDQAIDSNEIKLASVKILVIDEADYVLENKTFMNFFNMLFQRMTKNKSQVLLFSATVTQQVHDFVGRFIHNENLVVISVEKNMQFIPTNKHFYCNLKSEDEKIDMIKKVFKYLSSSHTFIFVNKKAFAEDLCKSLKEQGFESQFISNKLYRGQRDNIVKQFREGLINVLICTNMVARGLDIPVARTVVNFDMPCNDKGEVDLETYMHRQGRTGRFERNGVVINFISTANEKKFITKLENDYGLKVEPLENNEESIRTVFEELESIIAQPLTSTDENNTDNNNNN